MCMSSIWLKRQTSSMLIQLLRELVGLPTCLPSLVGIFAIFALLAPSATDVRPSGLSLREMSPTAWLRSLQRAFCKLLQVSSKLLLLACLVQGGHHALPVLKKFLRRVTLPK